MNGYEDHSILLLTKTLSSLLSTLYTHKLPRHSVLHTLAIVLTAFLPPLVSNLRAQFYTPDKATTTTSSLATSSHTSAATLASHSPTRGKAAIA